MSLANDLRDWVAEDDLVHFVIEAVEWLPLSAFVFNHKGMGDAQFPPRVLLALSGRLTGNWPCAGDDGDKWSVENGIERICMTWEPNRLEQYYWECIDDARHSVCLARRACG